MTSFQPLQVIAEVPAGVASASPWGVALDGLLAAARFATIKAEMDAAGIDREPVMAQADPADLDLPLARCGDPDGLWHWAATCAFPLDDDGEAPDVQYWMSHTDQRQIVQAAADAPTSLSDGSGRYRRHHMPLLVTLCTRLSWYAVGDPHALTELLTPLWSIGKKRNAGSGRVTSWQVNPAPELDFFTAAHLHPDGSLGRPTPPACLTGRQIRDGGTGLAGLRPPYVHPARQHRLQLPADPP